MYGLKCLPWNCILDSCTSNIWQHICILNGFILIFDYTPGRFNRQGWLVWAKDMDKFGKLEEKLNMYVAFMVVFCVQDIH